MRHAPGTGDPNDYMEVREESSDEEEGFGFGDLSSSDEEHPGTEAPSDGMGVIQEDNPSDKDPNKKKQPVQAPQSPGSMKAETKKVVKKKADLKKASLRYVCNCVGTQHTYVITHVSC